MEAPGVGVLADLVLPRGKLRRLEVGLVLRVGGVTAAATGAVVVGLVPGLVDCGGRLVVVRHLQRRFVVSGATVVGAPVVPSAFAATKATAVLVVAIGPLAAVVVRPSAAKTGAELEAHSQATEEARRREATGWITGLVLLLMLRNDSAGSGFIYNLDLVWWDATCMRGLGKPSNPVRTSQVDLHKW